MSEGKQKLMAYLCGEVRKHAVKNYEKGGWDILVECWDDSDIIREIESAQTVREAIKFCKVAVGHIDEYRRDIQGA